MSDNKTAWLKPINLPSPLLNLVSEAVKHQGEPVISSLLSQLTTPLYIPLKPDQRFERVCCFHGSRPVGKSPARWGSKGRANQESPLLEKRLGENRIRRPTAPYQSATSSMLSVQPARRLAEVTGPWFFHSRSPSI